jgi:ComF family protein
MKYGGVRYYAEIIGSYLAENVPVELVEGRTVIFPPMTFFDKFKRSFNQAEIIADKMALKHNLIFDSRLLKKVRKTKPQASLTYAQRQTNLKNAFKLTRSVKGENFLIVDDVCTTFSTINTISRLLKNNGAESVNAVTFARTSQYFN